MKLEEESTSKSFLILTIAMFLMKLMSLVYVPFLLHILKAEAHGIYTTAYEFFAFAYVLTNEGLTKGIASQVASRVALDDVAGAHGVFRKARAMMIFMGLWIGGFLWLFAPNLALWAKAPSATLAIRTLAPAVAISAATSAYRGYFQGRRAMVITAKSQIIEQVINVIFSLALAYVLIESVSLSAGVAGATSGTLLGSLLSGWYLVVLYRKSALKEPSHKLKGDQRAPLWRDLFVLTIPLATAAAASQVGNLVDLFNVKSRLIVSGLSLSGANEVYSYLSSYKTMVAVPLTVLGALATSLFPALAAAAARRDLPSLQSKVHIAVKLNALITIPSAVGLFLLSNLANNVLFDSHPTRGFLIGIGAFTVITSGLIAVQTVVLQAGGFQKEALAPLILGILVKLVLNFFLVANPNLRGLGAVLGSYGQGIVTVVLNHYLIEKNLKSSVNHGKVLFKPALAAALMALGITLLLKIPMPLGRSIQGIFLLMFILFGVLFYALALIALRAVGESELRSFLKGRYDNLPQGLRNYLSKD